MITNRLAKLLQIFYEEEFKNNIYSFKLELQISTNHPNKWIIELIELTNWIKIYLIAFQNTLPIKALLTLICEAISHINKFADLL